MGDLDRQLGQEIAAINRLLAEHRIDAGTAPAYTVVAGGSFVVYGLRLGRGQRLAAIADRLPELGEVLSNIRRAACPVRLRLMPAALEVAHPAPYALPWQRADLAELRPGDMLAGRSYSAAGSRQEIVNLAASPHYMISGATQSGKSTLAQMLVLSLACATSPADLDLRLVDLKNEDLIPLARLPHLSGLAVDRASALAMIAELHDLKDQRVAGGRRDDWRRVVLVIDELAELAPVPGALDLLGSIVSVGASKRINVIAATQKPIAGVVGSIAKAQFTTRLVGRVTDAGEAVTASGRRDTGAELLPGRGAFLRVDGPDLVRFQSYKLDDSGIAELVKRARVGAGLPGWLPAARPAVVAVPSVAPALQGLADSAPSVAPADVPSVPAAPSVPVVPPALAAVFALRYDGAGGLRRPGVSEALRVLYGDAAPASGRAYQAACNEVQRLLDAWRAGSTAGAAVAPAGGVPGAVAAVPAAALATIHKWPAAASAGVR